jgi:hypothetical protein
MKSCPQCQQANPDDARFCQQCGGTVEAPAAAAVPDEDARLRLFIGPNADAYLAQFKKFTRGPEPRFTLTWHWPTFLFDPFLWFLYRKMYLYAFVYAIGPVATAMLTGDFTVGIVWRVIAGVSANYIYFWHIREQLAGLRSQLRGEPGEQEAAIREAGGVQPYVIWVGVVLHLFLLFIIVKAIQEGPPEGLKSPRERLFPSPSRGMKTRLLIPSESLPVPFPIPRAD